MKYFITLSLCFFIGFNGCKSTQKGTASTSSQSLSKTNYERIKSLSGDWYLVGGNRLGKEVPPNLEEPFLSYSISSGGHSVIEKLFVNKPNEMVSIYYLDMGRLNMDHYCSLGNQPKMVSSTNAEDEISFELVDITNLNDKNDLHISSHALEFVGSNDLTVYWGATEDQKAFDDWASVYKVKRIIP